MDYTASASIGGGALDIFELMLRFAIVALASGTAGLLIGAMMASSKVEGLYDRLDRAEAANRIQAQLLDELAQALRRLQNDLAQSTPSRAEGNAGARQVLERLALAAEFRAHLDDPLPSEAP